MPVRLTGAVLALLILAGPAQAASGRQVPPASVAALQSAFALAQSGIKPLAGAHPRCRDGSFAGAGSWGLYFHMSECITKLVSDTSMQVSGIAGVFVYAGAAIPGGIIVLTYAGLLAAAVGAVEGLIWLIDRFECGNRGVTIFYSWAFGLSIGC